MGITESAFVQLQLKPGEALTCHEVTNEPLHIVVLDSMEEGKEIPDVATNLWGARYVVSKPIAHGGVMFAVAVGPHPVSLQSLRCRSYINP